MTRGHAVAAGAAVTAATLLAVAAVLTAPAHRGAVLAAAAAGVALVLVASLVQVPFLATAGLVLLGLSYAIRLLGADTADRALPLYAAGLVVVAELTFGALERRAASGGRERLRARVVLLSVLAAGAVAVATAVLASAAIPARGGLLLIVVGAAATGVALVVVAGAGGTAPLRGRLRRSRRV